MDFWDCPDCGETFDTDPRKEDDEEINESQVMRTSVTGRIEMSEQVTTLARLSELAKEKRSVSVPYMSMKYKPCAFIISMPGYLIQRMFERGMYVYEKQGEMK
jgi:hypothetical protein